MPHPPSFLPRPLVIATRESRLALWQAEHVKAILESHGHRVELLPMSTRGDQILERSLSAVGGKGLFVKELEVALEQGQADLAVHSLKDVPMALPQGFELACVMAREDPRDALVSPRFAQLSDLPLGARVGTSSQRRGALLKSLRPDLHIEALRGNLDTRLRKLDEGQFDAIVLAAAGLKRLGLADRIRQIFDTDTLLPAAGQGALGLEIRQDRADLRATLAPLMHAPTWLAVQAERALSQAMGGSCSVPLAAHAQWFPRAGDAASAQLPELLQWPQLSPLPQLHLQAAWLDEHASPTRLRRAQGQAVVQEPAQALALGQEVARALRIG